MQPLSQAELDRLSPPQRLALIQQLWDSLDQEHLPLAATQADELDRRLVTFEADSRNAVEWTSLRAELQNRSR